MAAALVGTRVTGGGRLIVQPDRQNGGLKGLGAHVNGVQLMTMTAGRERHLARRFQTIAVRAWAASLHISFDVVSFTKRKQLQQLPDQITIKFRGWGGPLREICRAGSSNIACSSRP